MTENPRRPGDDDREIPYYYRRPRSRNRWIDMAMEAYFSIVGPAQGLRDDTPPRGPRTPEEAAAGFGDWVRVTNPDGTSFLVQREDRPGR